ncbi:hypothetical protein [Falsirhodobacter xinxiangensis]|uniref:hypothetical protein n=1 Tax=Falsirhodobacter xinxiangensis TaxID=2530049 RepID=UPI00145BB07A|nr:hypothetical protein [Rhodobacter xinxiangensis]
MTAPDSSEDLVRIRRDSEKSDIFIIEVLGEPISALKQMKAEPWTLREQAKDESDASE